MATVDEGAPLAAGQPARSTIDAVACGTDMLIVASGELDLLVHHELRAALAAGSHTNLTVDLTDVSFVDITTITLLTRAAATRRTAGRRTVIINCQPQVRRVFWLTQAQHLLAA